MQLLDPMALAFEELEGFSATEDEVAAERAVAKTTNVVAFTPQAPAPGDPFPSICRASGWSHRARPPACAAAARGCASWARTSAKRWRAFRGSGR